VAHKIAAFGNREESERGSDQRTDVIKRSRTRGAEERFQLRERELDGVEVGTVGRQKSEVRADAFDRGAHRGLFVDREIVEDDHVAWAERGHQDLLDIGQEGGRVDRSVEDRGRREAVDAERRDHRVRLPMATGRVVPKAGAAGTAAVAAQQIGGDAALVEKHVVPHVAERLPRVPLPARGRDIRPALIVGVYRFF
jgi:hypothetical protein